MQSRDGALLARGYCSGMGRLAQVLAWTWGVGCLAHGDSLVLARRDGPVVLLVLSCEKGEWPCGRGGMHGAYRGGRKERPNGLLGENGLVRARPDDELEREPWGRA